MHKSEHSEKKKEIYKKSQNTTNFAGVVSLPKEAFEKIKLSFT